MATRKKEIYTYQAPWNVYGLGWSVRPDKPFRLALGSFVEEYSNKVEIIQLHEESGEFMCTGRFDHPYPTTKIMWMPDKTGFHTDLMATTGDYLRLWEVGKGSLSMRALLNNNKMSEYCAPLTALDWNETDPNMIGTASIDTTCTIWNLETQQVKTQLIAHDKEVYDIAFMRGTDVFASVGADGSLRMFDLRSLDHSSIMYESPELTPLLRLCWNKQDSNYLAAVMMDWRDVVVLDVRVPSVPVASLSAHHAAVNATAWAPHSSCHLCSAGDDNQALIWDISRLPCGVEDPILAYNADGEINNIAWSSLQPNWIAIVYDNKLQILHV